MANTIIVRFSKQHQLRQQLEFLMKDLEKHVLVMLYDCRFLFCFVCVCVCVCVCVSVCFCLVVTAGAGVEHSTSVSLL